MSRRPSSFWSHCKSPLVCVLPCLASCTLLGPTPKCSDLEIGETLRVVVTQPLDTPACDPELGFVEGAELTFSVLAYGEAAACVSPIGATSMDGMDLEYWPEASESASGSEAFVSVSRATLGNCSGDLRVEVLRPEGGDGRDFEAIEVTYVRPLDGSDCPNQCTAAYAIEVLDS